MKKTQKQLFVLLILLMSAATITITSCQKHDVKPIKETSDADINKKNIMTHARELNEYTLAEMQGYSEDMQREIFNEMDNDNKARLWQERIDYAIAQETDETIITRLQQLKAMISPDIFASNAAETPITTWVEENIPVLGFSKVKGTVTTLGGTSGPSVLSCNCSQSSDWCMSDDNGSDEGCRTRSCKSSSVGCGTIWLYGCNGLCVKTN